MQNAVRDGAEWAWVPSGDSCAFCIALASRGWETASQKALKGNHAQHIHANCDCTYAIRFDGESKYESYNPDKYKEIYDNASDGNSYEKINAIRREKYKLNKDEINASKRINYESLKSRKASGAVAKSGKDGIISSGNIKVLENFASEDLLEIHFNKHASEFSNISKEKYLKLASSFAKLEPSDEIVQLTRSDGSTSKYCFTTNEFIVINADGTIRTYFKPVKKGEYWDEEIERNK